MTDSTKQQFWTPFQISNNDSRLRAEVVAFVSFHPLASLAHTQIARSKRGLGIRLGVGIDEAVVNHGHWLVFCRLLNIAHMHIDNQEALVGDLTSNNNEAQTQTAEKHTT